MGGLGSKPDTDPGAALPSHSKTEPWMPVIEVDEGTIHRDPRDPQSGAYVFRHSLQKAPTMLRTDVGASPAHSLTAAPRRAAGMWAPICAAMSRR